MSGGQEKIFSILGPKLSDSKAQQYYWDKIIQIRVEQIDYYVNLRYSTTTLQMEFSYNLVDGIDRFKVHIMHTQYKI